MLGDVELMSLSTLLSHALGLHTVSDISAESMEYFVNKRFYRKINIELYAELFSNFVSPSIIFLRTLTKTLQFYNGC